MNIPTLLSFLYETLYPIKTKLLIVSSSITNQKFDKIPKTYLRIEKQRRLMVKSL